MKYSQGAQRYAQMELESKVLAATPHQLIDILFDDLQQTLTKVHYSIVNNNVALRGKATSRAINIIDEGLFAGLNLKNGGQIARELANIYQYLSQTLLFINRDADLEKLEHIQQIVRNISQAWQKIGENKKAN